MRCEHQIAKEPARKNGVACSKIHLKSTPIHSAERIRRKIGVRATEIQPAKIDAMKISPWEFSFVCLSIPGRPAKNAQSQWRETLRGNALLASEYQFIHG
jgi:hypothetical protein